MSLLTSYQLSGSTFCLPGFITGLEPYQVINRAPAEYEFTPVPLTQFISSQSVGWVGDGWRMIEVWTAPPGFLIKAKGGTEIYISPGDPTVIRVVAPEKDTPQSTLHPSDLDRHMILGPGLVFALALRSTWSLHASAAMFHDHLIVFLGESGQGKSTLAAYLSQSPGWRRVADDILPVLIGGNQVLALPYFPQLKLPADQQPCLGLPEQIPLTHLCLLQSALSDHPPELHPLRAAQGVLTLLSHTAGTRMFTPDLLKKHLAFSVQAGKGIPAYRLVYPHNRDALPDVRALLEKLLI